MDNKVDVIDIFINQIKRPGNKEVAKEDIIRFIEEQGIVINKRTAKSKIIDLIIERDLGDRFYNEFNEFVYIPVWEVSKFYGVESKVINSLKVLGVIKEKSKTDTYYNRASRDYYEMDIYPISILERYTSEELTTAYKQAYKQDEFRIRIETNREDDVHKIISELSKVFIVEDDPAVYEKKGRGINSYLKIKIANNTKIEEHKYMQDVHKLKTELKIQQKKYDEIMQYAGLINRLKKEYELKDRTELFSNVIRDVKAIKNKRASEDRDNPIQNKRNAGRKDKFTKEQKEEILNERKTGMTIRALARKYDCGVATVHKLISEQAK